MTIADAIVPLTLASVLLRPRSADGAGWSQEALARYVPLGGPRGARAAYGERSSVLWFYTAGGADVPYAGPDRSQTLPEADARNQF
ncbi:hypothetical protein GCM10010361_60200 [Streptomyces olivaceiscleroticus]|uniref:Uncharacterized protein n=1 Tax=Streptomyces olivaceiscleroticus TaxID=68245 RepID=A0ABN1AZP4_9ACTN